MGQNWVSSTWFVTTSLLTSHPAENAANLVYGFISLNNKFDLDDFDNKIQRIAIALVACCPKISAQYVPRFSRDSSVSEELQVYDRGVF